MHYPDEDMDIEEETEDTDDRNEYGMCKKWIL